MKILTKDTYYGSMNAEQQMNGILFSEYDYLTNKTDWHFHENPYFMYVLQGNLYDVNKRQKTTCPSGSFLLHNWQEPHFNSKESIHARGAGGQFIFILLDLKSVVVITSGNFRNRKGNQSRDILKDYILPAMVN